jgi:hypothetical protein
MDGSRNRLARVMRMETNTGERRPDRRPGSRRRWLEALGRLVLVLVSAGLMRLAEARLVSFENSYYNTYHMSFVGWLEWIFAVVLAGVTFGVATMFPFSRIAYSWNRLLLALIVALPLADFAVTWMYLLPRHHSVPRFLTSPWLLAPSVQVVFAAMVGFAIASGIRPRSREAPAALSE